MRFVIQFFRHCFLYLVLWCQLKLHSQIHFSNPEAYHEIYNGKNKWDKEHKLYHSMGEDRSSFGFLHYEESKERKDVLNRRFSAKAMDDAQGLVQDKV